MSKEGLLIGNKYGFHSFSAFTFKDKNPTGLCPPPNSAYEVRFYWTEAGIVNGVDKTDEVKINLLTLESATVKSMRVHNFYIFAK